MAMLLFTTFVSKAEGPDGTAFLKSLSGTYVVKALSPVNKPHK